MREHHPRKQTDKQSFPKERREEELGQLDAHQNKQQKFSDVQELIFIYFTTQLTS